MRVGPLSPEHAPLVQPLAERAFDDLARRQGRPTSEENPEDAAYWAGTQEHLLAHDGGLGAFDDDGALRGLALPYVRGDLWVLSLLVVEPGSQSAGTGSALLRAALDGAPPRRLLHSSRDARALRAFARAGFRLLPALDARGTPSLDGPDLLDAAADGVFAPDLAHALAGGGRLLSLPDGRTGRVLVAGPPGGRRVTVLEAQDDDAAADLLRGALALVDGAVVVGPLAPQEHWAVPVVLDAGLDLGPGGAVAVAGVPDPLAGPCAPTAVYV